MFVYSCLYVCLLLQVWDLRQNKLIYSMQGHGDSVTGLSLSADGSYLLSNSMDNSGKFTCVCVCVCVRVCTTHLHYKWEKEASICKSSPKLDS